MSQQSSAIELLGYAAASLTTLSFIPQAMRTLSSGDTRGISLSMYAFFTSGIALWLVYGIFTRNGPLIIANAITVVLSGLILQRKLEDHLGEKRTNSKPGSRKTGRKHRIVRPKARPN
ncbi:MAG: MtN3 and saliva related transmembrane protein [Cyanobium sp.]|jgi:MtN3 and saliva related transmembrane protein|uniref:SemiSWEET family sugar transporter n=1 Tax=Synechococcus sp. CS-1331 TaxID=2847973 RepID=UPI00223B2B8D|nr:SemiSWEET transporter [Synechococcus sp. CS-1331]MCT0226801.1 SemiSWEET transporter [Synechococcus sp. CS-1331]